MSLYYGGADTGPEEHEAARQRSWTPATVARRLDCWRERGGGCGFDAYLSAEDSEELSAMCSMVKRDDSAETRTQAFRPTSNMKDYVSRYPSDLLTGYDSSPQAHPLRDTVFRSNSDITNSTAYPGYLTCQPHIVSSRRGAEEWDTTSCRIGDAVIGAAEPYFQSLKPAARDDSSYFVSDGDDESSASSDDIEEFTRQFKQRRIKLGFTQVGKY